MKTLPIRTAARDIQVLFTAIKKGARVTIIGIFKQGYDLSSEYRSHVIQTGLLF